MPLDIQRPDLALGIVGTGIMGRGIAQIAAQAGIRVVLYDTRSDAAPAAKDYIAGTLAKLAEKGRIPPEAAARATALIEIAHVLTHLSPCHVVVEAIVEDLAAKRELFRHLEAVVTDDCLIATNTSSLQVTAIAAACKRPERVGGFHFFNPVPLMKVVEVIGGVLTAPWVTEALTALARRCGHTPVRAQDTPGFIVNHAGRGFGTEALQALREGVAEFYEIDRSSATAPASGWGRSSSSTSPASTCRTRSWSRSTTSTTRSRVTGPRRSPASASSPGLLGRKSGNRGFYEYVDGAAKPMPVAPAPDAASAEGLGRGARAARRRRHDRSEARCEPRPRRPSRTGFAHPRRTARPGRDDGGARGAGRPDPHGRRRRALRPDEAPDADDDARDDPARCATPRTRSLRATACRCR